MFAPDPEQEEAVLAVHEITKSFHRGLGPRRRTIEVLRGATMTARRGQLIGLVGENGSGKSTLLKIIVGMLDRGGGSVKRTGKLGYCPQVPLLWGKLTILEHFDLFASAYGLGPEEVGRARERLLTALQFERYLDYRVEELSGGTRQKLNLALSLMHDPDLLLLDEPYSGFDWETYMRFWEISAELRDGGMSILIVSHLISERDRLDRIYELRDGRLEES
ncbi:MAG: ABC transporter ATP-binding protein [bacterium]